MIQEENTILSNNQDTEGNLPENQNKVLTQNKGSQSQKPGQQKDVIVGSQIKETTNEKFLPPGKPSVKPEQPVFLPDDRINQKDENPIPETEKSKVYSDVKIYQQLLTKYVDHKGKVNYNGLKKDIAILEKYTNSLSDDVLFETGTKKEKLVLWINTYNAYTLLLVTKNYPIQSIKDVYNGKPWDEIWIRIGKKKYSLNQIENDIIRPQFDEPRIHFVLNCAAKSCPPLLNKALTPQNLETSLDTATKNFIRSAENELAENKVVISSLFDWYREDFGNVISF
ncbi:MAG: DUF547 domain-containing protein [Saprospiraceae bacterium]|nr:DUF547 domain-containing protein [Saprospiraceae bacterium]